MAGPCMKIVDKSLEAQVIAIRVSERERIS